MWSVDEASQKIQEISQVAFFNTFYSVFFIIFHLTTNKRNLFRGLLNQHFLCMLCLVY
jgi:hypothetical protein